MQDVFVWPPPIPIINEPLKVRQGQTLDAADHRGGLQILPRLQGENCVSVSEAVGLMMNREVALHVLVLKGQQELDIVQPSAHFERRVQRWNHQAEKLGRPTSCWGYIFQQSAYHH